jgi:hypothetical protein
MADKAKQKAPAAAPAAAAAASKGVDKKGVDELMKTPHGRLVIWVRRAYAIATANDFTGTKKAALVAEAKKKGVKSYPSGGMFGATSPAGGFYKLPADSERYKAIAAAVRSSFDDLESDKWTKGVQSIVDLPLTPGGGGGGGSKTLGKTYSKEARNF